MVTLYPSKKELIPSVGDTLIHKEVLDSAVYHEVIGHQDSRALKGGVLGTF